MCRMSDRTVTVTVPPGLYEHLRQRAEQRQRSIEDEVVLMLAAAVPAGDTPPDDFEATLASLVSLDDEALWRLARSRVAEEDAGRLDVLGDRRQRSGLTDSELREAEELVQRHDRVMVVRAEAAALLTQRGHDVSRLLAEA
jgi:plasmid stability protein